MLDHTSHPHVFDRIIGHLDVRGMQAMRATNSTFNDQMAAKIYRHVVLWLPIGAERCVDNDPLLIVDPYNHQPLVRLRLPRVQGAAKTDCKGTSFNAAFSQLRWYTRVIDIPFGRGAYSNEWLKVLQPLLDAVAIICEDSP